MTAARASAISRPASLLRLTVANTSQVEILLVARANGRLDTR
jgi:hypothetical protein